MASTTQKMLTLASSTSQSITSSITSAAATGAGAASTTSSAPTSTPLPPLAVITETDQRGLIIFLTALLLSFVFATFSTRVYTRFRLNGPWQADDNVLTAATFFVIAQAVIIWVQTVNGLGETDLALNDHQIATVAKLDVASTVTFIFVLWLSKVSHCLFFLRLTPIQDDAKIAWGAIIASTVWMVISILVVEVDCVATNPWIYLDYGSCTSLVSRWWAVAAMDAALELFLFGMAIYMFARLQTTVRYKLSIISVFACRVPLIVVALLRPHYLQEALDSGNITLSANIYIVLSIVETTYALISNTIPSLFPFVTPFSRHWQGSTAPSGRNRYANVGRNRYASGEKSEQSSQALNSNTGSAFTTASGNRRLRFGFAGEQRYNPEAENTMLRQDVISHHAVISHKSSSRSSLAGDTDAASTSSSAQQKEKLEDMERGDVPTMQIRKDMQWEVTTADRNPAKRLAV